MKMRTNNRPAALRSALGLVLAMSCVAPPIWAQSSAAALRSETVYAPLSGTPAASIVRFEGARRESDDIVVGWRFTVDTALDVTALGFYDADEDGLATSHTVGLWREEEQGELMAQTTVPAAHGAPIEGGFRYASITTLSLSAGSYVVGATAAAAGDAFYRDLTILTTSGLTWQEARWADTTDFVYPDKPSSRQGAYFGPNLRVLVQALGIVEPAARSIYQRNAQNVAAIPIEGRIVGEEDIDRVEVRYAPLGDAALTTGAWTPMALFDGGFSGTLTVPAGGWYSFEARGQSAGRIVSRSSVQKVGVGEIFITSGQSNSANSGSPALTPKSDMVLAWTGSRWRRGYDPQPIATGTGGSPWTPLGDLIVEEYGVPVGFMSTGWGGTRVEQWLPDAPDQLYPRLRDAARAARTYGARAVLWHQGESNASTAETTTTYAANLSTIIEATRQDAGWPIPWGVALVSFLPNNPEAGKANVRAAQLAVIASDPLVFLGPDTDTLGPEYRLGDITHFSEIGLRTHGRMWKESIAAWLGWKPPAAGNSWIVH